VTGTPRFAVRNLAFNRHAANDPSTSPFTRALSSLTDSGGATASGGRHRHRTGADDGRPSS
jgi:hypothetical protein